MNKNKIFTNPSLILLLLVFSAATQSVAEDSKLKIAAMLCLTGECAEWGINSRRGIELAAAEINQQGGILGKTVELVFEDSRDEIPSTTVSAYHRLTADKNIKFIIGPTWTIGGMSIAPQIAGNKNVVVISPSVGVKEFNQSSDNIFNTWPHDEKATRTLAQYAIQQGWKTAAILGSRDPWVETQSSIFEQEFSAHGGQIKVRLDPLPSSRDLRSEALKVKASGADVVFFSNYQVDVIAKNLAALNFIKPKLAILMEKERVKAAGGALEDTVFALYEKPKSEFINNFRNKFNAEPGITADTAYDALATLVKAISSANSFDITKVIAGLHNIKDFNGASGKFSFDSQGSVDKAPVLWKVKGLDYVKLENS